MDVVAGAHDVDNFGTNAQVMTVDRRVPHPSYAGLVCFTLCYPKHFIIFDPFVFFSSIYLKMVNGTFV